MTNTKDIRGYLENLTAEGVLNGWALNPDSLEEPARVYVHINQKLYTIVNADQMREDLREAGIRNGEAGFAVDISGAQVFNTAELVEIRTYLDSDGLLELNNSPLRLRHGEPEQPVTPLDPALQGYTSVMTRSRTVSCYFEGINRRGELYGWACDPADISYKPAIYLFIDEFPIGMCQATQARADLKVAGISNGEAGFSLGLTLSDIQRLEPGQKIHAYLDNKATCELTNSPYELLPDQYDAWIKTLEAGCLTRLTGTLEAVDASGVIRGWARDPQDSHHKPVVYFFVDAFPLGDVEASDYRGDLEDAGFGDGKCAFSWKFVTFRGLCALGARLQISAFFDPQRQRELSQSPIRITKSLYNKICQSLLDGTATDICTKERQVLIRDMLTHKTQGRVDSALNNENIYIGVLNQLAFLYQFREYDAIVSILDEKIIDYRVQNGLPVFELHLYSLLSRFAAKQLDEAFLQQFEGIMYREMESLQMRRRTIHPEAENEIYEESSDDQDETANADASQVDVELAGTRKSIRKQTAIQDSLWIHYDKCLRPTCIDNFNLAMVSFSNDRSMSPERYRIISTYLQVVGKCLASLFNDNHLALNYVNILGRDGCHHKNMEYYALAGRLNQNTGYNYEALQCYLQAAHLGSPSWKVYYEAGVILNQICQKKIDLYRQNFAETLQLLSTAIVLNPQQSVGFRLADNFLQHYTRTALEYTRQLALTGSVSLALNQRQQDLTHLAESIRGMSTLWKRETGYGHHTGRIQRKTILFVASQSLWQCFYYRTKQKLDHAQASGWRSRYLDIADLTSPDRWKRELMHVDILYIGRLPATCDVLSVMDYARNLGIPVIYDIDDLIFDEAHFPSPLDTYCGTITRELHVHLRMDNPLFRTALLQADVVTCSTQPLAEQIRRIDGFRQPVFIYPNLLSEELRINAEYYLKNAKSEPSKEAGDKPVQIFYGSATRAHKKVFYDLLCPVLARLLNDNDTLRITLIGYFALPRYFAASCERITVLEPSPNYMGYIGHLRQADINIAILEQDVFTDCKSELKWFEAGVFGIPSVVTPTATYRHVLEPERNVLFASTAADWLQQLTRLIQSAALRGAVGEQARQDCLRLYHPDVGSRKLKELVHQVVKPDLSVKTKCRILFVNVFFWPQSVGGATRIMESHIRHLMEHHADEFEIHVLTTEADPGNWMPYSVDQYYYGDALVTRLRVPSREWAEYQDEKVYAFCLEYYRKNEFDLIHFHSIQVLTASVVDAARELEIPYVITLHDGWWLSRYLFLMDNRGNPVDPSDPFSGSNVEQDDMLWLLERKNRLYGCLQDATRVLAVSEKFGRIHREAAIPACLETNENGLELFEVLERKPHDRGLVRVAHIGGISVHKGYDLLRATVTEGNFNNLEVTVIDHALEPGETYHDRWGTTPVKFMAKTRQSEVNRLYSQMDVLVAPSLWPESFGLVTREALYAGVWVIASDRGSVGDAIEDGVSGRVVDVSSPEGLALALREVDANPEPYTRQRPSIKPRLAETQATECVELYRSIVRNPVD